MLGAILAAQRIVKSGRECGHFREQAYEPLAGPAAFATAARAPTKQSKQTIAKHITFVKKPHPSKARMQSLK